VVVTLRKENKTCRLLHKQYARLTLDLQGKLVKLSASR
jgi:hypothetical protein